jgi:hypothetical protein
MPAAERIGVILSLAVLAGCGNFGRVNQGQVIAYDRTSGLITLIGDSNYRDPSHPRFDVLPPVEVRTPADPTEMGPEPEPGKLLELDWRNHRAVIFDAAEGRIRAISYEVVSEQNGVAPDDPRVSKVVYPAIEREHGTITSYFPRYRKLLVFSVQAEYLSLPAETWKAGDEIRYYYKDPRRALRLMNVSKTDLNKAGK